MSVGGPGGRDPVPFEPAALDPTLPDPMRLDPTLPDPTPIDPTRWNEPMPPIDPGYAAYPAQYPPEYPDLGSGPSPAGYPPPAYQPDPSYQPYASYQPYGYPATRPTSRFAIAALILSFVFSPAGIAFGHIARRQIARTGESGRDLATAALVIGYLHFAFTALLIVAGVTSSS